MDKEKLDALYQKCQETRTGPVNEPCFNPEYLKARREYQLAMVEAGLLSLKEVDK